MITDEQFLKLFNQIVRTQHLEGYKEISMEYHLGYLHGMEYLFDYIKRQTLKENHIVDTNEMIDQVPDVRKMVDDDVEKLELDYYKELEERREVAKNFQGQVAGRHPDMFGHSEMHHMVRGYVEGYNKAKETLYT